MLVAVYYTLSVYNPSLGGLNYYKISSNPRVLINLDLLSNLWPI
jgi:hypothetical protein